MSFLIRDIELAPGMRYEYLEYGAENGLPVVMLHGVTDSWHSFALLLPHLPMDWRILALTQRGHGRSAKPVEGYTVGHYAQDVSDFLRLMKIPSAVMVGHSMGAVNALRLALDHPQQIKALVLLGAFADFSKPDLLSFVQRDINSLKDPIGLEFALSWQRASIAQFVPEDFVARMSKGSCEVPAEVWIKTFSGLLEDRWMREVHKIEVPALLISGASDVFCGNDYEQLVRSLRNAKAKVYANAGHAMHWEEPTRVAADLREFIEELRLSAPVLLGS